MTTLNQYARPEWAAPRKETWYEHLLPQRVTDTINQSPIVGALSKYLNSPTPDLTLPSERDKQVPMPRSPSWFDDRPVATEALDKVGFLANFIGPAARLPAPAPKPQGIRAYHGSPHDFDRFDISKIGTGEGAQAYGRGLYFAEKEAVAKNYKDMLASLNVTLDNQPIDPARLASRYLRMSGGDLDEAARIIQQKIQGYEKDIRSANGAINNFLGRNVVADRPEYAGMNEARQALDEVKRLQAMGSRLSVDKGRMYEVRINADPEQFLDWDKPLSQQPEGVRRLVSDLPGNSRGVDIYETLAMRAAPKLPPDADTGWTTVVNTINDKVQNPSGATQALREAGIPGIRYLDQGSRAAGQGSRNFVVFDDALITILRKYGLLPPAAVATAAATNGGSDDGLAP